LVVAAPAVGKSPVPIVTSPIAVDSYSDRDLVATEDGKDLFIQQYTIRLHPETDVHGRLNGFPDATGGAVDERRPGEQRLTSMERHPEPPDAMPGGVLPDQARRPVQDTR
jgi:hypothetical protein